VYKKTGIDIFDSTAKVIRQQKKQIRAAGFLPEWSLFENSLAWYQIKKWAKEQGMEEESFAIMYKQIWDMI